MTQEEKQLLLKVLCEMLPYKPHCRVFRLNGDIKENDDILYGVIGDNVMTLKSDKDECLMYYQIKPYLRPMRDMTWEEICEFIQICDTVLWLGDKKSTCILSLEQIDWLNARHFDYRGLIEKGLALEAPEGMYETKTE